MALNFGDFIVIAALIAFFGGARYALTRNDPLGTQNARKLDAIIKHLNIQMPAIRQPGALSDDVQKLLLADRRIDAIKAYRVETGAGLKEAREAVDGYSLRADNGRSR